MPTVLIFEDDPTAVKDYRVALVAQGLSVHAAASISEARKLYDAHKDAVGIIVDGTIQEGGRLNTLELVKSIRNQGFKGAIVAASSLNSDRAKMMATGHFNLAAIKEEAAWALMNHLRK